MCGTPDFKHHAFPAGGNVRRRFKLEGVRRHAAVGFPPYQDLPAFNAGSFLEPDAFCALPVLQIRLSFSGRFVRGRAVSS